MDALIASYGDAFSDDSDTDTPNPPPPQTSNSQASSATLLPPPPLFLLEPPNPLGSVLLSLYVIITHFHFCINCAHQVFDVLFVRREYGGPANWSGC